MWRSVAAVVFGYVVTGILIFGTDKIFSFIIPNFNQMHALPTYYFGVSLAGVYS
ncbi:MAG TPA: hypothetical protein VFC21_00650 [Bryobacteraceae bacterium]|nr:hypothetical protein [Bryobacteraceae bacterium]